MPDLMRALLSTRRHLAVCVALSLALGACTQAGPRLAVPPDALPQATGPARSTLVPAAPPAKPQNQAKDAAPKVTPVDGPATDAAAQADQQVALIAPRLPAPRPAIEAAPISLPQDPAARLRLLARPPVAPPFNADVEAIQPVASASETPGLERCREGVRESRAAALAFLSMPPSRLADTDWVEDALRMTELATIACQTQGDASAAAYWRATAFFLHGQYARAAVNFRRLADAGGDMAAFGYAHHLATVLEACARVDRNNLDLWRLAGLNQAMGRSEPAAKLYAAAATSQCAPLAATAQAALGTVLK